MSNDSYYYYLQFLNLPRNSNEDEIRLGINKLYRVYRKQTESHDMGKRHEAEKQSEILDKAEKVLLGAEGLIIRNSQSDQNSSKGGALMEMKLDPDSVAGAIERFVNQRGRKLQERQGTSMLKRATTYFNGVEYTLTELVHKAYQANLDEKRCVAVQDGLLLFDWYSAFTGNAIQGITRTFIPGAWAEELIALSAGIEINNSKV